MIIDFAFIDIASPEILVLLVVAALIFGGKKVADASKTIGSSLGNGKKEVATFSDKAIETRQTIVHQAAKLKTDINNAITPTTEKASSSEKDA